MASKTWISVLACVIFSCASACPPEQLIQPCRCSYNSIICKDIIGQDILDEVFRGIGNTKVRELILSNSQVDHIPVSAIEENDIQRIIVFNSAVAQLFDEVPSTANRLALLELNNVTFQNGLLASQMKPLQELEILYLKDTEIPVIGQEFSESLSQKIKAVSIINTKTQSMGRPFVGKVELEVVRINKIGLKTLKRDFFPFPSNNLKDLSFDWNQIEILPDDIFDSMSQVHRVSLANNRISELSESVFGGIFDQLLSLLNVNGNPIKCDCSIKWVTDRDLRGLHIAGKCAEPQSLAGKNIRDLKESDLPRRCPK